MRAIVIDAAGPAFSAGHDLSEMIGRDVPFYQRLFDVCSELMETIHRVPQPVIAKVHGMATAAGCQLVAACDLAVAADGRTLRHSGREDRPVLLDADGAALARDRPQACAGDAAHRPADHRRHRARLGAGQSRRPGGRARRRGRTRIVDAIVASSPLTVGIGKEAFYAQIELDEHRAYDLTKAVMAMNARTDDAQEGMCAFLEKRSASWRNR